MLKTEVTYIGKKGNPSYNAAYKKYGFIKIRITF